MAANGIPKVGVYVCDCGSNIAGTVDVKSVAEFASALPGVVVAREYKYVCSEPGQQLIQQDIKEQKLERVVVASCSPRMHEPTFQGAVAKAGLNPFYFAMVNIREHVSWIIKDKEQGTAKAKRLIRAAVARVLLQEELFSRTDPVTPAALVVGAASPASSRPSTSPTRATGSTWSSDSPPSGATWPSSTRPSPPSTAVPEFSAPR